MDAYRSCCIIDDDEFFAFNAKKLIIDAGFSKNVLWYSDGQEAIDGLVGLLIANIHLPDIILLDLNMPNKNGWEFLDEFSALPVKKRGHVKIFVASSFISQEFIEKAKEYNLIEDYLVKPLTQESLGHIISSHKKIV